MNRQNKMYTASMVFVKENTKQQLREQLHEGFTCVAWIADHTGCDEQINIILNTETGMFELRYGFCPCDTGTKTLYASFRDFDNLYNFIKRKFITRNVSIGKCNKELNQHCYSIETLYDII